jgi:hypothetical protein
MKNLICTLALIGLLGCKHDAQSNLILISNIPATKTIEGTDLKIPPILLKPVSFEVVDSFLIVAQNRSDSIFSIFRLPECEYMLSFGMRGRGPDEFMTSFPNTSLSSINAGDGRFAVDNMMNNVQYYSIKDLIKKNYTPYKIEKLPTDLNGFQGIKYLVDTTMIIAPYRGNMHLAKYSTLTNTLSLFKEYSKTFSFEDTERLRGVYGCYIDLRPNNKQFVITYSNCGIIEIFRIDDNLPLTISYEGFPSLEDNLGLKQDSKTYILDKNQMIFSWAIKATNKYIYALVFNTLYDNISDGKGLRRTYTPEIHVFNWSGKFIANLKLNKYFKYFDISMDDKYLYAIDNDIENLIRRYNLTDILP